MIIIIVVNLGIKLACLNLKTEIIKKMRILFFVVIIIINKNKYAVDYDYLIVLNY